MYLRVSYKKKIWYIKIFFLHPEVTEERSRIQSWIRIPLSQGYGSGDRIGNRTKKSRIHNTVRDEANLG